MAKRAPYLFPEGQSLRLFERACCMAAYYMDIAKDRPEDAWQCKLKAHLIMDPFRMEFAIEAIRIRREIGNTVISLAPEVER